MSKEHFSIKTLDFLKDLCKRSEQKALNGEKTKYGELRGECFDFLFDNYKGVSLSQKPDFVTGVARGFTSYKQYLLLTCNETEEFKEYAKALTEFFVLEFQQFMLEQSLDGKHIYKP